MGAGSGTLRKPDYDVDILVVGGGPAGVAAAFAAARLGAQTMVVEQFNCLGGVATAGGHGHICLYTAYGTKERVVGGVPYEMAQRIADEGYGVCKVSDADFEVEGMKLVLEQMAQECGVTLLYHTFFSETLVEKGRVVGALVQNKNGRQWIRAGRVIDCTGDGDVAASAGCGFEQGNARGNCQPMTLMFTIGGVDWQRVREFRGRDYGLRDVWLRAQGAGDMSPEP